MRLRTAASAMGVIVTATLLAACTGSPAATPTVTTTTTVTVTATPPAVTVSPAPTGRAESPNDPVTALGAWSICAGIAVGYFPPSDWKPGAYTPDAVKKQKDGSFRVTVGYDPKGKGSGAAIDCEIGGTLAAPDVQVNGPYDFG